MICLAFTICHSIEQVIAENHKNLLSTPIEILKLAAGKTTVVGSSTCCLLTLDPAADYMHVANIGDSGLLVLRKKEKLLSTILRSSEQCHGFNFPFQVML